MSRMIRAGAAGCLTALLGCGPQVVSVQDQVSQPPPVAPAREPVGLSPEEATRQVPTLRPLPGRRRVRPPAYEAPAAAPDPDPSAAFAGPPPPAPKTLKAAGEDEVSDEALLEEMYAPE
ncbi:MAG: hypothetical protein KC613_16970 [Myxococcales bacterium]|nr:hypothetical protein [Myxococcales bacterium]MCB9525363.1 hypothetical protein [Myxococcales bacterium]